MKFYLPTCINWCKIMKISFSQLLIALVFTGITYAKKSDAQNMLSRVVNISLHNSSLSNALKKLEKQADVKFIYSLNVINVNQRVSVSAKNERLDSVLNSLFPSGAISYQVINDRIVLGYNSNASIVNITERTSPRLLVPKTLEVIVVRGKVSDAKGAPLPGVTVQVKGTNIGTTTDVKGIYSVDVLNANDTLVFSYIGYVRKEVPVHGRAKID